MVEDKKTIDDVYALAGKGLSKVLDASFSNQQEDLVKWFYQPNKILNCSPAEYCSEGKQKNLSLYLLL